MATLQQALTRIDTICPNAWDDAAKLLWLNECESMIQTRILGTAPEACITYDADTARSTALLVPAPFDRLYVYYVIAMCDYAAHETAHYADSMMLFNAALDEYAKWYQRTNGTAAATPGAAAQIAANSAARHTHENKGVLDGITAARAAAWDAKVSPAALGPAVNTALQAAKDSGAFRGEKGDPGTPGKDGDPGKDGAPGKARRVKKATKVTKATPAQRVIPAKKATRATQAQRATRASPARRVLPVRAHTPPRRAAATRTRRQISTPTLRPCRGWRPRSRRCEEATV